MTLAQFQRFNFYPGVALIYETAWRPWLHVPRENSKTTETILIILVAKKKVKKMKAMKKKKNMKTMNNI